MSKDFIFDIGPNKENAYFLTDEDYVVELYHAPMEEDPFVGSDCYCQYVSARTMEDAYFYLDDKIADDTAVKIAERIGDFIEEHPETQRDIRNLEDGLKFCKENNVDISDIFVYQEVEIEDPFYVSNKCAIVFADADIMEAAGLDLINSSKEDIAEQLERGADMCKAYLEGDSVGYAVYDKDGWEVSSHSAFVGEQGDAITDYISDDGCGSIIEGLGEYSDIEQCLADNFPAGMPSIHEFSDGASHMFLMENDVVMQVKHMNDPDMSHPYFSDDCAGFYTRGDTHLSGGLTSETYHEVKDRLGAFLADHMHVEDGTYCGDPVKIVSFPGIIDVTCRLTLEEFEKLDPAKILDEKFHNRYDLGMRETLECIERNGIKIDDILAYEFVDRDEGGHFGIALLEDKRVNDFYGDRLVDIDKNEIGVYLSEAVEKHSNYFDNDTFMYVFYDTAGRGGDCEISYKGTDEVKATIADAKCYLGQHDDIDECLEANKNVIERAEKSKGRGGDAR